MLIHKTTVEVVHSSMMKQDVDAIVNAANPGLNDGRGITGLIFGQAGKGLPDEIKRKYPHGTPTGTAVITHGHNLKQPYIVHSPGPVWYGGKNGEPEQLASSYRSCLEVAEEAGLKSIAFCSISTGIYGYPLDQAAPLAIRTTREYLDSRPATNLERIVFAMWAEDEYGAFSQALADMAERQTPGARKVQGRVGELHDGETDVWLHEELGSFNNEPQAVKIGKRLLPKPKAGSESDAEVVPSDSSEPRAAFSPDAFGFHGRGKGAIKDEGLRV